MKYYSLLSLALLTPLLSACALHEPMDHPITSSPEVSHEMNHADMVKSEFDFIYLMIPHHEEAIISSNILIKQTAQLKDWKIVTSWYNDLAWVQLLASNIANNQAAEVVMMKKRLSDFYSGVVYEGMPYKLMMRDVSTVNDSAATEKMYITDMIVHHQGAIDMANKLLEIMNAQDPLIKLTEAGMKHRNEVKAFAQAIISAQSKEIEEMEKMISN